jgi:hypothetical protein
MFYCYIFIAAVFEQTLFTASLVHCKKKKKNLIMNEL